ncbi:MAG: cation:proton antiporter [Moheibacter sp.]
MEHHLPHLIQDLSLILGAAVITTLIFRKLKQPLVLGYIIAGLLVGPEIQFLPTVVDNASISTWASIGVIFLLFSLGLEFSFKKLMKVGGTASMTAFTEIIFIMFAGYFVGQWMGWNTIDSIFLGGMLASSSTTIIIRAFDELKVKSQPFARTVFGVLIVEDIVVILLLVLLPTIAISQQFQGAELFFTVLRLLFFLLVWFLAGIFIVPSLLKANKKLIDNETLMILAIGFCFGMVVLATKTGFSAELGAFIMGSIFAETTKAERIEHVLSSVKDLFAAIFFVSIGMMIDLNSMWEYITPILIITLLTIFGKFFSTTLGALLSGQTLKHSVQVGMSMAQIGEFAFIIATLGLTLGVTSDFLFPIAVGVSVITTFTTPYMIKSSNWCYQGLQKILPERLLLAIDNYSNYNRGVQGTSQWRKITRSILQIILINGFISLAIIILFTNYLYPYLMERIDNGPLVKLSVLVLTALAILPFLWALINKKTSLLKNAGSRGMIKKYTWMPFSALNIIRILIGVLLVIFMIDRIFNGWLAFAISIVVIIGLILIFRKRIQKVYDSIEKRFIFNLNERETKNKIPGFTDAENANIPWDVHLSEFEIQPNSLCTGSQLVDLEWREKYGVNVALIKRGDEYFYAPDRFQRVFPFDTIYVLGTDDQISLFQNELEKTHHENGNTSLTEDVSIQKVILSHENDLIGKSIKESGIRDKTSGLVVGIERTREKILNPSSEEILKATDVLWIVGNRKKIRKFQKYISGEISETDL